MLQYAIEQATDHDVKGYTDLRESMKRYRPYGLDGHGNILTANQIGSLFAHYSGHGNPPTVVGQSGIGIGSEREDP